MKAADGGARYGRSSDSTALFSSSIANTTKRTESLLPEVERSSSLVLIGLSRRKDLRERDGEEVRDVVLDWRCNLSISCEHSKESL